MAASLKEKEDKKKAKENHGMRRQKRKHIIFSDDEDEAAPEGGSSKRVRVDEKTAPTYLTKKLIDVVAMEATEAEIESNFFTYPAGEAGNE